MLFFGFVLMIQRAFSYINVTGGLYGKNQATGQWPLRQEIRMLAEQGQMWDLYIQALAALQYTSVDDALSYYQVAGIHGYPLGPWDDVGGSGGRGFCMHNSVLFPIWHRPYLALYEQILLQHAYQIAYWYPPANRSSYLEAAKSLRIPYWDWALGSGLPPMLSEKLLQITTPDGIRTVENPLYQYNFSLDMSAPGLFPTANGTVLLLQLKTTVRHYDTSLGDSDMNAVSTEFATNSFAVLHKVYQLLTRQVTWRSFAKQTNATFDDLESLHGMIHNQLGGKTKQGDMALGHMTVTDFSAFDPSFWLHHANVDRLTAVWQALNDDVYVEADLNTDGSYYQVPGATDTLQTPLAPFHSEVDGNMWNAATARNVSAFGYTYPELLDAGTDQSSFKKNVIERINKLYNPNPVSPSNSSKHILRSRNTNIAQVMSSVHADTALRLGVNNLEVQWYLRVQADNQYLNKLAIFFFVGEEPSDSTTWSKAKNLIGSYVPLFGSGSTLNVPAYVDVSCTHTIAAAVDRGLLRNILPEATVPFIKSHVRAKVVSAEFADIYDLVHVSVVSQRIQPRTTFTEFPQYEDSEEHGQLQNVEVVAS